MGTRVFVVDDAALFRRVVSQALEQLPDVEVVGTASNGKLALTRLPSLRPDLITLDIEMPEMNGIQFLEALSTSRTPAGVVVLSSLTRRGGELTLRALELGAFDFVTKPESGGADQAVAELRDRLAPILRAFARKRDIHSLLSRRAPESPAAPETAAPSPVAPARPLARTGPPLVLIGVSTGGPAALSAVIPQLPAGLAAPVLVVQHMPPMFTAVMASSLNAKSAIRVKEAEDGEPALAGCVYIAPGGRHMKVAAGPRSEVLLKLTDDPPEHACRPAVDYLFRSAALQFPGRAIAAILTGMGQDGTQGLKQLKRGGCFSIAQDEASSVVYGMPKAAVEAGLVDAVLPLSSIAAELTNQVAGGRR